MKITPAMRQQAKRLARPAPLTWTQKPGVIQTVTGTSPSQVATVRLSGDPTDLTGMKVAPNITVSAGQAVWVAVRGTDAYVQSRRA